MLFNPDPTNPDPTNPDPTKQATGMLYSRKRVDQNHPLLFFNNVPVGSASDHKHLGITLYCWVSQ